MEREEHKMLPGISMTAVTDLLQVIKAEADRWIQAGASGLRALAQG